LAKKKIAMELLEHADFGLSAQVLQEFYVTVTRKIKVPWNAIRENTALGDG
jgi:predicted nucleic acid-binding protein